MGESPDETRHARSACSECQRRKQKCNREWPCNHCQKRKVADKCHFGHGPPGADKAAGHDAGRKRQLSLDDPTDAADANPWDDDDSGFAALGYTASHLFSGLNTAERRTKTTAKHQKQYNLAVASCPQLERALRVLPPRPYTDSLVQNFLNSVNYHYYIIYPPSFLDEYRGWWAARSDNGPLGLQWTCLLLMVCACSAQYIDAELQRKLELDLGETTQRLTQQYHNAARELRSVIPVGNSHLLNVQSLLHSCYWYQSEARFVECWHVLSAAIREAQELGIHQEVVAGPMSEFEREMRRRIWTILDTWDWQISALLSRPMIIDRTDCRVGLPSLKLEGYSPSPLLHLKLQSELIAELADRFRLPKNVASPADVKEYQKTIETWMSKLPPVYALNNPDKKCDAQRPWIVLHRHYLHTMSYSMLLDPLRAYLARPTTRNSPPDVLKIRSDGIDCSLRLMSALYGFFDHVYPRDAKFHVVLFCIFDTAAVLCSALMHDEDTSVPRRDEILGAIDGAVDMLRRLNNATKTAKASYDILVRVSQRITRADPTTTPNSALEHGLDKKRPKVRELALTPPSMNQTELPLLSDADSAESSATTHTAGPSKHPPAAQPRVGHSVSPTNSRGASGPAVYAPSSTTTWSGGLGINTSAFISTPPADPSHMGGYAHSAGPCHTMTPPTDDLYQPVEFGNITQQELGDLATMWDYESLNLDFINPQA